MPVVHSKHVVAGSSGNEIASVVVPMLGIGVAIISSRTEAGSKSDSIVLRVGQHNVSCRVVTPAAVLKGNLRLASAVFPKGVAGANLDILARGPLWQLEKDYNHGTGHGIGYYLNVHEGPQNINWKIMQRYGNTEPFAPGMVTSDEPGFYLAGEFGIFTEEINEISTALRILDLFL